MKFLTVLIVIVII